MISLDLTAMETAQSVPVETQSYEAGNIDFNLIPLRALNVSCRRQLSIALLPERPLLTIDGITRDWQGLCELAGFSYDLIVFFKKRSDPVSEMLDYWCTSLQPDVTVAELIKYLELMERFDVISDIQPSLARDSLAFLRKQERAKPVQVPLVSSGGMITTQPALTTRDALMWEGNDQVARNPDRYDAYVSFVDSDAEFVTEMIAELEVKLKLKFFIKERDGLGGLVELESIMCMINDRCDKVLLIVSPAALADPQCEWQAVVAQASAVDNNLYTRKVIPVICKPCTLPTRYRIFSRLDFSKRDVFGTSWLRLYSSIKCPITDVPVNTSSGSPYSMTQTYRENHSSTSSVDVTPPAGCVNNPVFDSLVTPPAETPIQSPIVEAPRPLTEQRTVSALLLGNMTRTTRSRSPTPEPPVPLQLAPTSTNGRLRTKTKRTLKGLFTRTTHS